jgi:hypothetical protein
MKCFLPQCHVVVTDNSTVQVNFGQHSEVELVMPESLWKKQVLLAKLGMKKGHSHVEN